MKEVVAIKLQVLLGISIAAVISTALPAFPQSESIGAFSAPFSEPTVGGAQSDQNCIPDNDGDGRKECKPTAAAVAILPNKEILYWNALEGTEDVENGVVFEYGRVARDDQSRVLQLNPSPRWSVPKPERADFETAPDSPLFPSNTAGENGDRENALFCTSLVQMANGKVLVVGGTSYYFDPGVPGAPYGVSELQGVPSTRIYDPRRRTWTPGERMNFARWYPSALTLSDGRVFVASGTRRMVKAIYPDDRPQDSLRNVVETETFDPATGKWTNNGEPAERSLPLYPRLHLLPNGHVFYNAAGQVYNPNGSAYDEATWNTAASYDPGTRTWTDLGIPGIGTVHPGFRGSTFSMMLPLKPDADGAYRKADFVSAGGILGPTPGTYVATTQSAVTNVDTSTGKPVLTSHETGPLAEPRWYSSGVVLPDGSVMAFSGGSRDEVVAPGTETGVRRAERFDPATGKWQPMAIANQNRTYHNTAALLPDGRVLIGGHAPIPTLYGSHRTLPGGFAPNEGRDPSLEIYSPPYVFRGDRPKISKATQRVTNGQPFTISTRDPARIESVLLVRNTSVTHLVDPDQRSVQLNFSRKGSKLQAVLPGSNVVPPGPYLLFINAKAADGTLVPSEGFQVTIS